MPTSATCSPALANLPAFTVSDQSKVSTGTHGKLSRGQATALWLKLYKNLRAFGSLPYSKHLSDCYPDDLADYLAYLMVNGFFFTQTPFMEHLYQAFSIENEFIASLPSTIGARDGSQGVGRSRKPTAHLSSSRPT